MLNNKVTLFAVDYQGHSPERLTTAQRKRSAVLSGAFTIFTIGLLATPLLLGFRHMPM